MFCFGDLFWQRKDQKSVTMMCYVVVTIPVYVCVWDSMENDVVHHRQLLATDNVTHTDTYTHKVQCQRNTDITDDGQTHICSHKLYIFANGIHDEHVKILFCCCLEGCHNKQPGCHMPHTHTHTHTHREGSIDSWRECGTHLKQFPQHLT